MAILPVSSVSFKGQRADGFEQKEQNHTNYISQMSHSMSAKTVPVMVLMALNSSLLNAAVPADKDFEQGTKVVMVEDAPIIKADASTYVLNPEIQETQQSKAPFGWEIFNSAHEHVKFSMPAKGNGKNCHLVFTGPKNRPADIGAIYIVRDGKPGSVRMGDHPPEVQTLVYHNLGDSKENFCSVITMESLLGPDRTEIGSMMSEIMLDDDSAQKIIDLVSGDTKWNNKVHIQIREVYDAAIHKSVTTIYK